MWLPCMLGVFLPPGSSVGGSLYLNTRLPRPGLAEPPTRLEPHFIFTGEYPCTARVQEPSAAPHFPNKTFIVLDATSFTLQHGPRLTCPCPSPPCGWRPSPEPKPLLLPDPAEGASTPRSMPSRPTVCRTAGLASSQLPQRGTCCCTVRGGQGCC